MKIGVFDSGLGGLVMLRALTRRLPEYDYIYLGDTQRVPYGNRSAQTIYRFTEQAVATLFRRGCAIVVLACNTASAAALRRLQREWLPRHYPDRRILGVIVPTVEAVVGTGRGPLGIIGTNLTIESNVYGREIRKRQPRRRIWQQATPLLVPLIEHNMLPLADPILRSYLRSFRAHRITSLILGCTHYPLAAGKIQRIVGPAVTIVRQDRLVPQKFADYLRRHPELVRRLSRTGRRKVLLTDITPTAAGLIERWFGKRMRPWKIRLA